MVSRWILRILSRQEVARLMLFAFAPDEDNEALAGCNDVASLKAGVVHGPLVCSFGVLLIGWRKDLPSAYARSRRIAQTGDGSPARAVATAHP